MFEALEAGRTGLDFSNKLTPTQEFNVFKYMYFYNGGGVGAADFNNDGKIDIFFAANQVSNRLYLNEGGPSLQGCNSRSADTHGQCMVNRCFHCRH